METCMGYEMHMIPRKASYCLLFPYTAPKTIRMHNNRWLSNSKIRCYVKDTFWALTNANFAVATRLNNNNKCKKAALLDNKNNRPIIKCITHTGAEGDTCQLFRGTLFKESADNVVV